MHLFVSTVNRFARWMTIGALCGAPLVALAADDDHVVTQIIKGMVYVSLGTRDGVAVGQRVEVLDEGKHVLGTLDLELCGEVICRARLPAALEGKLARGMLVRPFVAGVPAAPVASAPVASAASAAPEPSASESVSTSPEPESSTPPPEKSAPKPKKKKPKYQLYTGLTLADVLAPYGASPHGAIPPSDTPGRSPREVPGSSLVKAGWWTWGGSFALGGLISLGGSDGSIMLLPVLGPWIYAGREHSDAVGLAVVSGLGQAVGVIMIFAGYSSPGKPTKTVASLQVSPILARDTWGLGLSGTL